MVVTIGRDGGVGKTHDRLLPALAVSALKGTSLHADKMWNMMKQKPGKEPTFKEQSIFDK